MLAFAKGVYDGFAVLGMLVAGYALLWLAFHIFIFLRNLAVALIIARHHSKNDSSEGS